MPVFSKNEKNAWISSPSASGPFKGLQGGAVAGLLVSELEDIAIAEDMGPVLSASIEFLRPTGVGTLQTKPKILRHGKRASVLANCVYEDDKLTAKATVCCIKALDVPEVQNPQEIRHDPEALPILPSRQAPHGGPWMMDNFEVRAAPQGIAWFREKDEIVKGAGPMTRILGPADWTHGIARPKKPKLADPNLNLQITIFRQPVGVDIGISPQTTWMPNGIGFGDGLLYDVQGPLGRVMMSVALTPFN